MAKTLIISINSPTESTGGGHYLRTLISSYVESGCNVTLLAKNINDNKSFLIEKITTVLVDKTSVSDVISRFCLTPSFIFYYIFLIFKEVKRNDVIAFHSSRLGFILYLVKVFYPNKKYIMHFDNVESDLIKQIRLSFSFKGVISVVDRLLIPFSEWLACKNASICTFITNKDANEISKKNFIKNKVVFPFFYVEENCAYKKKCFTVGERPILLFTGSFDFYPNQHCLDILIELAKNLKKFDFYIAGRSLNKFANKFSQMENITIFSDVSNEKLIELYLLSNLFICPVVLGSGMKTKIAEALSFSLPVISHINSSIGYDKAIESGVVKVVDYSSASQLIDAYKAEIEYILLSAELNADARIIYEDFYSIQRGVEIIRELIKQ